MNLIKQSDIDDIAENQGFSFETYEAFKDGVKFAESKFEELAIEFVEWVVGEGWVQAETYNTFKNVYHANIEENVRLTTEELLKIFIEEHYE
jgi:hypothetical protein